MRKYILDFVFDQVSGESKIIVDFNDDSMTILEINEAIHDGEIRENIIALTENIFGQQIAYSLRNGNIELVCLDNHPEEIESINIDKISNNNLDAQKRESLL